MSKTLTKPRVSRDQWLKRALQVLEAEGMQGVRVDRLARDFDISRAGFYWHFRDRRDLLSAMLDFWAEEFTDVVIEDPELQNGDPVKQLERVAKLILDRNLARYDLAIRDWSAHDKAAARVVRKVYRTRLEFVRGLFRDLGFRGRQLEMRTRLFVCYHSWEHAMFGDLSKSEKRQQIKSRIQLLVGK